MATGSGRQHLAHRLTSAFPAWGTAGTGGSAGRASGRSRSAPPGSPPAPRLCPRRPATVSTFFLRAYWRTSFMPSAERDGKGREDVLRVHLLDERCVAGLQERLRDTPRRPRAAPRRSSPGRRAARCPAPRSCRPAASTGASFPGCVSARWPLRATVPRTSAPPPQVMMSSGSSERRQMSAALPHAVSPFFPPSACDASSRIGSPSGLRASMSATMPSVWGTMMALRPSAPARPPAPGRWMPTRPPRPPPGGPGPCPDRTRSHSAGARRREDHGVRRREPQCFQGHGHGEVPVGQRYAARVAEEVADAGGQVVRDLPRAELVRDDAGQDAAHVLSFHRGPEDW